MTVKTALILSTAAIGLVSAPLAVSQVIAPSADEAYMADFQTVQLAGQRGAPMTYDRRRGVFTMAPLLESVTPAVVSIRTLTEAPDVELSDDQRDLFERFFGGVPRGQNRPRGGIGSGVIIDASEGLIITNNHVVDNADEIEITLEDRREFIAEVVGRDEATDLALLKIDARNLKELVVADVDNVQVGDYVIAVGNPFGLSSTVTSGIISALGRDNSRQGTYSDFIQTDASINPGNSGGALVNSKGELIGINTAIVSRSGSSSGIGFAVPARIFSSVIAQLNEFGEVRRGRIGVLIRDLTPELRQGLGLASIKGALISDVTDDSPAERAGLESGDVVIEFNGRELDDSSDLRNAVGLLTPGTRADVTYLRDGRRRTTQITVEANSADRDTLDEDNADDIPSMQSFSGATITNIPEELDLRDGRDGVYISNVRPGSRAARAGLTRGDIIRGINRTEIDDLDAFETFIERNDGPYALIVERDGQRVYVGVR